MNATTHRRATASPDPASTATMRAIVQERYGSSDTWRLTETDRPGTVAAVGAAVSRFKVGASGGVGTYAVQLAKANGAEVTGVCSAAKADLVRSLGADNVIDYATSDATDGSRHYDLILDIAGNASLRRLRRALNPTGSLVIVGGESKGNLTGGFGRSLRAPLVSVLVRPRLTMPTSNEHHADLVPWTDLIDAGQLTPSIERTYSLDQAQEAMRQLEAGTARGKICLTIPASPPR